MVERAPLMSVIIIAVAAEQMLREAVVSILTQDIPAKIIVVNSNGGSAKTLLAEFGNSITVIDVKELLYASGARNRGIAEAKSKFIAFLASDCIAAPGWIAERLKVHRAGHAAVASAVMPFRPFNLVSWADQLLLFPHRLPYLPEDRVNLYGVSFQRKIFETYGVYNELLKTGEDSEFLKRLKPTDKPQWCPKVITLHRNNTNFLSLLVSQYHRGHKFGIEMRKIFGSKPQNLINFFLRHSLGAHKFVRDGLRGRDRILAYFALPIVAVGCLAKAWGIYSMQHLVPEIDAEVKRASLARAELANSR